MQLISENHCKLKIGSYPTFSYNASRGGGFTNKISYKSNSIMSFIFDVENFSIPAINSFSTKLLGLPLPPGIQINIHPELVAGELDESLDILSLDFKASFKFSVLNLITAPDLYIDTNLISQVHDKNNSDNQYILSGTSIVNPTGNLIYDKLLGLPTTAFACLKCRIEY